MKTTILAVNCDDSGTPVSTAVLAHFETTHPISTLGEARLMAQQSPSTEAKRVTNSKRVRVIAVDRTLRSDCKSGDTFRSAAELSRMLGYKYPAVSQALKAAEAQGDHTAVLEGVEFTYAD